MRDFALQLCFELRNQCSFLALQCSALHQSAQLEQDSSKRLTHVEANQMGSCGILLTAATTHNALLLPQLIDSLCLLRSEPCCSSGRLSSAFCFTPRSQHCFIHGSLLGCYCGPNLVRFGA